MMRKFLMCAAAVIVAGAAHAQTLTQRPVSQGAVSRDDITQRLEGTAERTSKAAPKGAARGAAVDFCWPMNTDEYRTLGKFVIVLVSVVSEDGAELPLRRVYVTVDGQQTELQKVSSARSDVRKGTTTFSVLGPYREDGFYVAPAGLMMKAGILQADFAVHRNGFNLYKLPGSPPDFIKADTDPMPPAGAKPDQTALKAMLQREYTGFDLPPDLK